MEDESGRIQKSRNRKLIFTLKQRGQTVVGAEELRGEDNGHEYRLYYS